MKILVSRLYADPKYARALEWGKLISITGAAQIFIQFIGLLSGIMIIRLLPTHEYALYTLANTMLATMTVMADGGIGSGVLASGGKVWRDRAELGKVIATAIYLRKKIALATMLVALPVLVYLLIQHQAGWMMTIGILLSIIPAFYAAISDTLLEVPLKLNQDIAALQKNQVFAMVVRFITLAAGLFFMPLTIVAMLAGGLSRVWANLKLKYPSAKYADFTQHKDQQVTREISEVLKATMPGTIYYCAASQITIWLISLFGTTESIAQVGALGRIAALLSIITMLFTTLLVPRFARLSNEPKVLLSRFIQIAGLLSVISLGVCIVFYLFPDQILFVLGEEYKGLRIELLLITISACIMMVAGVVNSLSISRAWALPPLLQIPVSIFSQLILMYLLDLSILNNILWIAIANAVITLMMYCSYFFYRVVREKHLNHLL